MLAFSVTFFITLLNIAVLYIALRALLFKPLTRFMEARRLKIKGDLEQASLEKVRSEELRASYEERLRSADQDADRILREARAAAQEQAADIVKNAEAEAARIVEAGRRQSEEERLAVAAAFKAEAATLVLAATGRLLRREVSGDDARRAAADFIAALGKE